MWKLTCVIWIQWVAIAIFLYGFLAIKEPKDKQVANADMVPNLVQSEWLRRKVGHLVLVVIDALRADFVMPETKLRSNKNRPKIQKLHDMIQGQSHDIRAFVARANAPTVTMPRIKALMSGTIPGFVDFILNFGSAALHGDHLIEQWHRAGRNMTMFGDDTWLKLFPRRFIRSDGTTSFFVSDFTQVDDNVTRHLEEEMRVKEDWDVCILHYLGLDHIGHVLGPEAPVVATKLDEMDGKIQFIYEELVHDKKRWRHGLPPLVIIMGDHGMADAGGHGGSSPPEILTPMIFLTPLELGTSSKFMVKQIDLVPTLAWLTGVPIPKDSLGTLMFQLSAESHAYNREQIAKVVGGHNLENEDVETVIEKYEENLTEYNLPLMMIGALLAVMSCYLSFGGDFISNLSMENGFRFLHILSLLSTSFIEEEHQTIYFIVMSILAHQALFWKNSIDIKGLLAMLLMRFARTLNQTGDKWRHILGFNEVLKRPENANYLILSVIISLLSLFCLLRKGKLRFLLILVFIQKYADVLLQSVTWPAQIIYSFCLLKMIQSALVKDLTGICQSLFITVAVITPAHNQILLPLHLLLERLVQQSRSFNMFCFLGWSLFFHSGNSNGIASIDVAPAYVGINSFNPWTVGTLLALSTFCGPILWILMAFSSSPRKNVTELHSFLFFRGAEISLYLILVTHLRHHLFVWTVFSPKLLYLGMAVLVINIELTFLLLLI